MKLWTFQPLEIAERLEAGESFACDPLLAEWYNLDEGFARSYDWLVGEMEQVIPKPEDAGLPVVHRARAIGAGSPAAIAERSQH